MASRWREDAKRSFRTPEDADREWLVSLFASFAEERADLDTMLSWRAECEMRGRPGGFPGRVQRFGDRRRSPGRRRDDPSRAADSA